MNRVFLFLAVVLYVPDLGRLSAQTGEANGGIHGVVTDQSGASVKDAQLKSTNLSTGFQREVRTNDKGEYEVPLLPLGKYKVELNVSGFTPFSQSGVSVDLAKSSLLNITLQVGTTAQSTTVESDASILNTETIDVSGSMNEKSVMNMPLTSRNSFNLALFGPGYNGTRDDEFGNPTFAFGGMQRKGFLIDGIDNTQRGGPGRLGIFSPETIQEVKVLSNSMAAEYGRTVGGIVSMVTKGGTNDTHGEFLVLQRRPGLIARPSLAPKPKPFQQWATYNLNLGGPVRKNKLFYFVGAEYEPEDGARPMTITPANAAALHIAASDLGSAPFKQRFQTYLGRLDYQLNAKNNFYVRYSEFFTPSQYNTSGGQMPQSAGNNFTDRDDTFASQWTRIVSPESVNEMRFGLLRREFTRPPVSGSIGPIVSISGVATLGSNSSAGQYYDELQYNFIDNFSRRWGRHQLKFGVDVDTIHVVSHDRLLVQYSFASLSQYLNTQNGVINPATGRPFNYTQLTQDFGTNNAAHRSTPINLFAQDEFQVNPNLTVYYGLRWEYRVWPALQANAPLAISRSIPNDPLDFAPRFGFSWQLRPKTVLRGGYGIFYDTLNLRNISLVDRQNGNQVLRYVIAGTDPNAPQYPADFASAASAASFLQKPSVNGFSTHFKTQYAHQANMQVEQELARDLSVTVGVQWYGGHRQPVLIDTNLGSPVGMLVDGRPKFASANRPNPNFNQIFELQSIGNSVYYGGFVSLNKRFSKQFQLVASYTLGYAFNENDAVGDNGSNVFNPTNLHRDWGWSSSDQRHRFVAQGVWQPSISASGLAGGALNGWTIAPNLTYASAFPVSVVAGSDLNGDGVNNDFPLFQTRNQFRGYGFGEVNLRISRTFALHSDRFRLEIIGEAENLMNSTNVACNASGCTGAVANTFGSSTFLQPTVAFNSRQIQLGGRFRF